MNKCLVFTLMFLHSIILFAQKKNGYIPYSSHYSGIGRYYETWGYTKSNYSDTSFIGKTKFKSIAFTKYNLADSTFKHKELQYKEITQYNPKGEPLSLVRTNWQGKVIAHIDKKTDALGRVTELCEYDSDEKVVSKETYIYDDANNAVDEFKYSAQNINDPEETKHTKSVYDGQGNLLEFITYNTNGGIKKAEKNAYDVKGQLLAKTEIKPRITETKDSKDLNKTLTYTTRFKRDTAGNIIETAKDSEGIVIEVETEMYDAKNREIYDKDVDHGQVQEITTDIYDKLGGYTETDENFDYNDDGKTCGENEKEVTIYDKDGNELSDIDIDKSGDETDIRESTTKYKFKNGKIVSETTTDIAKGDGEYSKSISTITYVYDKQGNLLQKENKGGGLYSSSDKDIYTYNSHNKVLVHQHYSACSNGTPEATTTTTYYNNGTTIKDVTSVHNGDYKSIKRYSENGLLTEETTINGYNSSQILYEYTSW